MDWPGTILNIFGAWLNAKDAKKATVIWLIANLIWIAWSIHTRTYSILLSSTIFMAINIRTLVVRWKRGTK
jgi:hypothetical protein